MCRVAHLGPPRLEVGKPVLLAVPVHDIRVFRPVSDRLMEDRGDDPVGRPLQ